MVLQNLQIMLELCYDAFSCSLPESSKQNLWFLLIKYTKSHRLWLLTTLLSKAIQDSHPFTYRKYISQLAKCFLNCTLRDEKRDFATNEEISSKVLLAKALLAYFKWWEVKKLRKNFIFLCRKIQLFSALLQKFISVPPLNSGAVIWIFWVFRVSFFFFFCS